MNIGELVKWVACDSLQSNRDKADFAQLLYDLSKLGLLTLTIMKETLVNLVGEIRTDEYIKKSLYC